MKKMEQILRSVDFSRNSQLKDRLRGTLCEAGMSSMTRSLSENDLFLVNAAGDVFSGHAGSAEDDQKDPSLR